MSGTMLQQTMVEVCNVVFAGYATYLRATPDNSIYLKLT